jgi:phospholipid/cholesterol/gamma-HCH transport system permease protein
VIIRLVQTIGSYTINTCIGLGSFALFFIETVRVLCTTKPKYCKILESMYRIGVESLTITVLTGLFTGMVFALQSYVGFARVGGEQFIGVIVAMGMIRELGPVLTGLMVTGRAGSAIAAEIGTMNISEQIDALKTLGINVFQYLVVPRVVAGTIIFPFLTIFAMICGIVGGYFICIYVLFLSPEDYVNSIVMYVDMYDIVGGLVKASVFGFILTLVGSYKGYHTTGGARGVGTATMQTVVTGSIMILISNYFLTKLLEQL